MSDQSAKYWDAAQADPRRETTGQIHLRIPGRLGRKTAWVRAANGKPLAEWAGDALDRAAEARSQNK